MSLRAQIEAFLGTGEILGNLNLVEIRSTGSLSINFNKILREALPNFGVYLERLVSCSSNLRALRSIIIFTIPLQHQHGLGYSLRRAKREKFHNNAEPANAKGLRRIT